MSHLADTLGFILLICFTLKVYSGANICEKFIINTNGLPMTILKHFALYYLNYYALYFCDIKWLWNKNSLLSCIWHWFCSTVGTQGSRCACTLWPHLLELMPSPACFGLFTNLTHQGFTLKRWPLLKQPTLLYACGFRHWPVSSKNLSASPANIHTHRCTNTHKNPCIHR